MRPFALDVIYIIYSLFSENIRDIRMNGTNLTYMGENCFDDLTKIPLKNVFLDYNLILNIHPHSLTRLIFLGKLYISHEKRLNVDFLKTGL